MERYKIHVKHNPKIAIQIIRPLTGAESLSRGLCCAEGE